MADRSLSQEIFLSGTNTVDEFQVKCEGSESEMNKPDPERASHLVRKRKRARQSSHLDGEDVRSTPRQRSPKKLKQQDDDDICGLLHPLQDYLCPGLDVVFCGINPGRMSAETGHHFANPTNHFWRGLYKSGMTTALIPPSEDFSLPERFNIELTNLVDRPSTQACDLSRDEMMASVPDFLDKIERHRPRFVCFVGMVIWDVVQSSLVGFLQAATTNRIERGKGKGKERSRMGLQSYKLIFKSKRGSPEETLVFVVPCTSGRVVRYQLPDKIALFTELKRLLRAQPSEIDTSHMDNIVWPSNLS